MVNFMKESPDIAKNMSKRPPEQVKKFWDDLRLELNKYGPPAKEVSEWKKVWSDHKSYLKKKLAYNNKELAATGGGPYKIQQFTADEEEVVALIQLRESAEGVEGASYFGPPHEVQPIEVPLDDIPDEPIASSTKRRYLATEDFTPQDPKPNCSSRIQEKKKCSLVLLEEQVKIQEKLYADIARSIEQNKENLGELNSNVRRIYRSLDRIQEQQKQHFEEMQYIAKEKLKVKQRLLEIELEKRSLAMNVEMSD